MASILSLADDAGVAGELARFAVFADCIKSSTYYLVPKDTPQFSTEFPGRNVIATPQCEAHDSEKVGN